MSGGAIQTFMRTHPNVQVRVIEGLFDQLVSGVRQGRLDFSVGGLPAVEIEDRLHCDILFQNRIVPAVRHDHPLANARSFSDLVDCEWALTTDDPTYIAHLNTHFSSLGLPAPRIRLRCESFFTLLQLAPHIDFVVAISHTLLRHPVTAKHLRPVEISDPCPTARFALVRKADVPLTPHARALAHYISAAAAELRHLGASTASNGDPWTDCQRTLDKDTRRRSHALGSSESHMPFRG